MALETSEIIKLVSGSLPSPKEKNLWVEESDRISFHAKGIRPRFYNVRWGQGGERRGEAMITPANYEQKYQYLIDNYILNRHPNEQWQHYQWRLSTFPLIAQEIYLNAESQILGSIYQNSQYTIEASSDDDEEYLDDMDFVEYVKRKIPRHIFTDPHGKIAVVEKHFEEFPTTEKAMPGIELVESCHILYFKPKEAIFFVSNEKYNDKKLYYWIDTEKCIKMADAERSNTDKVIIAEYAHNFGYLPVFDNETNFFKPFVHWADLLCRNMSDDEVIAKNASYPHITVIKETCAGCGGDGKVFEDGDCEGGKCRVDCGECGGKGTVSYNPGEYHVVKDHSLTANESGKKEVPQVIRFDNPDISINEFSFKRWKEIREMGLRSMHLKFVEDAQSGVAKAFDWQQFHYLVVNVKDKLFEVNEFCLYYILAYLNPSSEPNYVVVAPTQFMIKTESDIQDEYKTLVEIEADLAVRRQKQDELMQTVLTGNALELKKWEVIKNWDVLWGMNDTEISNAKLIAGLPQKYFIMHIFAGSLLQNIETEKGSDWIVEQPVSSIITELNTKVTPFIPTSKVEIPDMGLA